uniref:Flavodoxin-like domain-containing protein n=1 Tax=Steinernema glaseri TaxID=37863 RepID=A0A1I7Y3Z9_9BILA
MDFVTMIYGSGEAGIETTAVRWATADGVDSKIIMMLCSGRSSRSRSGGHLCHPPPSNIAQLIWSVCYYVC